MRVFSALHGKRATNGILAPYASVTSEMLVWPAVGQSSVQIPDGTLATTYGWGAQLDTEAELRIQHPYLRSREARVGLNMSTVSCDALDVKASMFPMFPSQLPGGGSSQIHMRASRQGGKPMSWGFWLYDQACTEIVWTSLNLR